MVFISLLYMQATIFVPLQRMCKDILLGISYDLAAGLRVYLIVSLFDR